MEMFFLPPHILQGNKRAIDPTVSHKWTWNINTISVSERVSWKHECAQRHCLTCNGSGIFPSSDSSPVRCHCLYRPLSIVIRFESYFPWPVNLIHHYVLQTNTQSIPQSDYPGVPFVPYKFPPTLLHNIPSTVRFFGLSVLTIGEFGTLIWTDGEDSSTHASSSSGNREASDDTYFNEGMRERVVGRRLGLPSKRDYLPSTFQSDYITQYGTSFGWVPPTLTFSASPTENWYSIDLCERAGRLAVGNSSGGIEVWDYF